LEIWIEIWTILAIPSKGNEKFWNMPRKLKWKNLKFFIFEIWKKFGHITRGKLKNWNKEIIYFVYATEIKLPIIPLHHLCIPPYTTCASCGGIQLISAVRSFHIGPFPTVV
jgi:hypothetical protein